MDWRFFQNRGPSRPRPRGTGFRAFCNGCTSEGRNRSGPGGDERWGCTEGGVKASRNADVAREPRHSHLVSGLARLATALPGGAKEKSMQVKRTMRRGRTRLEVRRGARALLAALLGLPLALGACASAPPPSGEAAAERSLQIGLGLYDAGEYARAGERFRESSTLFRAARARERWRDATAAECTAWLRARYLQQLDDCSQRLGALLRRDRRSDPGANTLVALGAVAGGRAVAANRIPREIAPILRTMVAEAKR